MSSRVFQVGSTPTLTITVKKSCGTVVSVANATLKKIRITTPSGSSFEVDLDYVTDGADGKLQVTLTAAQLAKEGEYQFQVFLTLPNGWDGPTKPSSFTVARNLPSP